MSHTRAAFALSLLTSVLAAQNTWVVDPSGNGNFTSLGAAQAGAAPGDTLILVGSMPSVWALTKPLHLVAVGAGVYGYMNINAPGPVSISGGTFEHLNVMSPTSLDGVTTTLEVLNGGTLAARDCTFYPGNWSFLGGVVELGGRAVFDGCTFYGRSAYAVFGTLYATAALGVAGDAELRDCEVAGGSEWNSLGVFLPGAAAIELTGNVDLRDCQLSSGQGSPLITGSGLVRYQAPAPLPPLAGITVLATDLPWTTGTSGPPGGVLTVNVDGPATTLAGIYASLGMRAPIAGPFGDVWVDLAAVVGLAVGITDANGSLSTTVAVPPLLPKGLQVTFQSTLVPAGGPFVVAPPAILHVY